MRSAAGSGSCSCGLLRQASRRLTRLYDEALAPAGLSLNQYALLRAIERAEPRTLGALAATMVMDRSTVGHLLRPLAARGLVAIEPGAGSGRERRPMLTTAAATVLADARRLRDDAEVRFATLFGADDVPALRALLARVAALPF